MKTSDLKVSVVIPVYNGEKYIACAIESVLRQTHRNLEVIVVDDGSKDLTVEIIKSYNDPRVVVVSQKNSGVAAARNTGILNSSSEYICFLDQDDWWARNKVEKQLGLMLSNQNLGMVYCDFFKAKDELERQYSELKKYNYKKSGKIFSELIHENYISSCTLVMIKKSVLNNVGMFNPNLLAIEDLDLWLRISIDYEVAYVDEILALYRMHNDNTVFTKKFIKNRILGYQHLLKNYNFSNREKTLLKKYIRNSFENYAYSEWIDGNFKLAASAYRAAGLLGKNPVKNLARSLVAVMPDRVCRYLQK